MFGTAGPELEKLRLLLGDPRTVEGRDDYRISFLKIYNCIRDAGGKISAQRADIFMNDSASDGTGVTHVIKAIHAKLILPAPQPTAQPPRN